ncbi:hypothetical protein D3C74_148640 [compost metagenome]
MNNAWKLKLEPGAKWSGVVGRGKAIRFTSLQEHSNVSLILFHAKDLSERYNMPDTLKAQHTSHLTKGNVLLSDNGRVLASIVEDTLGWHDPIGGYTTRKLTDEKYGLTTYQEERNAWNRSGEENFIVEMIRNGMQRRDLGPTVNLFSKVYCGEDGTMHFEQDHASDGDFITLRMEMDVLVVISNTPHPLNPETSYPLASVELESVPAVPSNPLDYCVNYRPENRRAFENTWQYYALQEQAFSGGVRL